MAICDRCGENMFNLEDGEIIDGEIICCFCLIEIREMATFIEDPAPSYNGVCNCEDRPCCGCPGIDTRSEYED